MKIKLTSIYVDDQAKALRFYTEVLGFAKNADVTQGSYRWLTVASPEDPEGPQLQLALNTDPVARGYQEALFEQNQPAAIFHSSNLKAEYERIQGAGGKFAGPLEEAEWGSMAVLDDTCGNLIQLTQPAWG